MSYVYCIISTVQNAVKIGYTTANPCLRLTNLQTGNPDPLRICKVYRVVDPPALEKYLHEHYAVFNRSEEWFESSILPTIDHVVEEWVKEYTPVDLQTLIQERAAEIEKETLAKNNRPIILMDKEEDIDPEERRKLLERVRSYLS